MNALKQFLFKNSSTRQTVAKNTFWLLSSDVLGRLLRMGLIVYAARTLGVSGWGIFSYATSIGIILMTFSDIGLSGIITREATQKKDGYKTFISTALALKSILLITSIIIVLIVSPLISHIPGTRELFPIIAAISLFDSLRELCFSINSAFEKMEREMYVRTIMNLVILILGIVFLKMELTPKSMALAYAVGSAVGFVAILIIIRKDLKSLLVKIDTTLFREIFIVAWPYAIITLVVIFLANIDIYMLGIMKGSIEVGLYSSVQRIYAFTAIIPATIGAATLPLMSRLATTDSVKFQRTLEKTVSLLLLFGAPIALGGTLLAKELIVLIFGPTYTAAVPVMIVLMLQIVIAFPFTLLSNAVFAYNKQRGLSSVYLSGIIVNIAVNFFLIPKFGATGAAIATFLSTFIMTVIIWIKIKRVTYFEVLPTIQNIFIPLGIMVATVLILTYTHIHVVVTIVISAVVYFCSLLLFKEPLLQEIRAIITSR